MVGIIVEASVVGTMVIVLPNDATVGSVVSGDGLDVEFMAAKVPRTKTLAARIPAMMNHFRDLVFLGVGGSIWAGTPMVNDGIGLLDGVVEGREGSGLFAGLVGVMKACLNAPSISTAET